VSQSSFAAGFLTPSGPAAFGTDPRDVVIGVSPGVGRSVWKTLSGLLVVDVLQELLDGLEEEGCRARIVRINSTIDLGMVGLNRGPAGRFRHRDRPAGQGQPR